MWTVVQSYEDTFRTKGTHKWPEDPTEQRQTWTRRSQIPFILTWISFGIILTLHAALTGIERPRVTHELIDYFYGNYLYVSRFRASTSHLLIAPVCCSLAIWVWAALTLVELVVLSVQLHANLFEFGNKCTDYLSRGAHGTSKSRSYSRVDPLPVRGLVGAEICLLLFL